MANPQRFHKRTIPGMLYGFLLPFVGFVSIACILAASDGTRPFWNFVPEFLSKFCGILVIFTTWGYVPIPFPALFLSAFAGGYLAGRVDRKDSKYLPYTVFLVSSTVILASIDHKEFSLYWPISAAMSFLPFLLGKSLGDRRRLQEWNPDWLEVPRVLLFYPLIFAGLSLIANSLYPHGQSMSIGFVAKSIGLVARLADCVIGFALVQVGKHYRDRLLQRYRDRYAESVCEKVLAGETTDVPPFVMYLRPFSTTGRLPIKNPDNTTQIPNPQSADSVDLELDFETALEKQLRRIAPVVALGNAGEEAGPGRVQTNDDEWQDRFQRLVHASKLILLVPAYGRGTLWEIRWLKENAELGKLIGICPPKILRGDQWFESQWQKAREELASSDVALPPFEHAGFSIEWFATGQLEGVQKFGSWKAEVSELVRKRLENETDAFRGLKVLRRKMCLAAVYTMVMTMVTWSAMIAWGVHKNRLESARQEVSYVRLPPKADQNRTGSQEMDDLVREGQQTEVQSLRSEIALEFNISPEDFVQFMEAEKQTGKPTVQFDAAWAALIKEAHVPMRSDVTAADFASAHVTGATVAAYLRIRRSQAVDDLCVSPEELSLIQTQWSLPEREAYAKVLQRAGDLVVQGRLSRQEQAYEQALREYAEKKMRCLQSQNKPESECSSKAVAYFPKLARTGRADDIHMLFVVCGNGSCVNRTRRF